MEGGINTYRRGTLLITILDASGEREVWSAWTTEKVKAPQHNEKQINNAVKKLLRKFPPR
jgi:hypothetical protein